MAVDTSILIITRASDLARKQTDLVHRHLLDLHPDIHFQINAVSTKGDEVLDKPLAKIGDKGLFTQALEEALLFRTSCM